jgi:hypothetical protein
MKGKLLLGLGVLLVFGFILMACDTNTNNQDDDTLVNPPDTGTNNQSDDILVNTTWYCEEFKETLKFSSGNNVSLYKAESLIHNGEGKYTLNGNSLTLNLTSPFVVTYSGTINGNTMNIRSGTFIKK